MITIKNRVCTVLVSLYTVLGFSTLFSMKNNDFVNEPKQDNKNQGTTNVHSNKKRKNLVVKEDISAFYANNKKYFLKIKQNNKKHRLDLLRKEDNYDIINQKKEFLSLFITHLLEIKLYNKQLALEMTNNDFYENLKLSLVEKIIFVAPNTHLKNIDYVTKLILKDLDSCRRYKTFLYTEDYNMLKRGLFDLIKDILHEIIPRWYND